MKINVHSEIGKLTEVLVHRPGKELENLTPNVLERLLFDDIPWLEQAQKEHDQFTDILRSKGVKVYYLEKLMAETLEDKAVYNQFLDQFIEEAVSGNEYILDLEAVKKIIKKKLEATKTLQEFVDLSIAGIIAETEQEKSLVKDNYFFLADPLPNLYFQRDPFASISNGVSINTMFSVTRNRETIYSDFIFRYHPSFKENKPEFWYGRNQEFSIEGGDQLVLNKNTLLVGRSQRTRIEAIVKIANNIIKNPTNEINKIVVFDIGKSRKFMHLDTVFTQVDVDKFSVHPGAINEEMNIWYITEQNGEIVKELKENSKLEDVLKDLTGLDKITLIKCGDGNPIAAAREQWNDGANTLAIAPGEVIVYSRNPVTNKALEAAGVKINIMDSAELSRGRGGPRCMSMPLSREEL